MLSKIERGQLFPTLPTLVRIAMVFGIGLEHFFSLDKEKPLVAVVRKAQRLRLPAPPDREPPAWLFESLDYPAADRRIEAFYAEFPTDALPAEPHRPAATASSRRSFWALAKSGPRPQPR